MVQVETASLPPLLREIGKMRMEIFTIVCSAAGHKKLNP
jgi:hypothetical protein